MAIETERLALHEIDERDADFVLRLVNEPSFLRYIGDRGVRTLADARKYITDGPVAGYARYGHGLMRVVRKADGAALGMCGILKRDTLQIVGKLGRRGRNAGQWHWMHALASDAQGNLYTGEGNNGRRGQKFLFRGLSSPTTN